MCVHASSNQYYEKVWLTIILYSMLGDYYYIVVGDKCSYDTWFFAWMRVM